MNDLLCGTQLNFPREDPAQLGLNSGSYYDNSIIYPGTGDFSVCWGQNPSPTRIVTTFVGTREAGAFTR